MKPIVSVVIPAYNAALFLPETIQAVLDQDMDGIEVIVVDDKSTDNTAEVMKSMPEQVIYHQLKKNHGNPSAPRNVGMHVAQGEYIALLDADDLVLPGKFEEQVRFLETVKDVPFVLTNFRNFKDNEDAPDDFLADHDPFHEIKGAPFQDTWYRLRSGLAYETLIYDNFVGTSTAFFRRSLVDEIGYFDETLGFSEDIDYWIRIARIHDLGYIDKEYHRRRLHDWNLSSDIRHVAARVERAERLWMYPLSDKGRDNLNRYLARLHFGKGYHLKCKGQRLEAIKCYLKSFKHKKDKNTIKAIIGALVPR